ncbi:LysR substrate-binding domain-containing protein [Gammaproteobacteria bacterium]|nr:LysR substrate-binding domain-containing protein [Gammaproteobacteria bacterium]MDA7802599.1 LysR substrate-binding domain-containing protein [Gammaproteobacteria bacterium]MDA8957494.1 LysR substrate-binding domain-containing protein [Gammaproteobacteria bacterium]MDA9011380.1 LysR substrate-binding domain-containing protein [Gammaproteobacteria bacterium]MDA9038725.1 LysR substrate-binding domain-containing protein [Gammaproteobacteria bacterium]|tara:strand:+ start:4611 stop:5516 length:906 start_codon:yes stop_codon:yes gene_type:complete
MITLKQIHYALTIEKELHFKKAADACYVSPSTLSNAISEMEAQLGIQIFERTSKKVIVTSLGKEILKKARAIKMEIGDINQLSEDQKNPLSMPITLGIIPTVGPYFIPLVLPSLKKKFPNLKLKIIEAQSSVLVSKVNNGEIDMAILAMPYKLDGLLSFKFWEENFYYISYKGKQEIDKDKIRAKEIDQSDLMLLNDDHCLKNHVLAACKIDSDKQYSIEASSLTTLTQLVAGNMGSTLVPHMAIKQLVNSNSSISKALLDEPGPHRELVIIIRPSYSGLKNVKLLKDVFFSSLLANTKSF